MQVKALVKGRLFQDGEFIDGSRQVRQPLGKLEDRSVGQSENSGQALPGGGSRLFRPRQVQRRIGVKRLFPSLTQLAEVAHLRHPAGQFGAGLRSLFDFAQVAHRLFGRDGGEIGLPGVGGQPGHRNDRQALGLREIAPLDLDSQWHGDQGENIKGQRLLDLVFANAVFRFAGPQHREVRIGEPTDLHKIGLADPQIKKAGLQPPVVE